MQHQAFLTSELSNADIQTAVTSEPTTETGREKVRILVIGSSYAVERIVFELYRVGFAEVGEWSKPQSTGRLNEVMRVLTRYVLVN